MAVLLIIAILSTIATIGLRQFSVTARASRLDATASDVDYQALGALSRAWELVATNLDAGTPVPHHDLAAGVCTPPSEPTDTSQVDPITVMVRNEDTGLDVPYQANQRAWIYATYVCDPAAEPIVVYDTLSGPPLAAGWWHFRYSWMISDPSLETRVSPPKSVRISGSQKPAFLPPTIDRTNPPPIGAEGYYMYVAWTASNPTPPASLSSYRRITLNSQTRACPNLLGYRCLTQNGSGPNPQGVNAIQLYMVVAKGWSGESEAAPQSQKYLMGGILFEKADRHIFFSNSWQ